MEIGKHADFEKKGRMGATETRSEIKREEGNMEMVLTKESVIEETKVGRVGYRKEEEESERQKGATRNDKERQEITTGMKIRDRDKKS